MSGSIVAVLSLAVVSCIFFGALAVIQFRAGRKWRLLAIAAVGWGIITIAALSGWLPPL